MTDLNMAGPVLIIAALLGGLYMSMVFSRMRKPLAMGVAIGAGAATIGALLPMVPLEFCTFGPDQTSTDVGIGIALVLGGMALLLYPTQWVARLFLSTGADRPQFTGERVQGGFNTSIVVPILLLTPTIIILAAFLYYPAIDLFRLSTLLTRLGNPRTAFRCVNNFTELINLSFSPLTIALFVAVAVVIGSLLYMQRRQSRTNNRYYEICLSLRTPLMLLLLLTFTLDLFEGEYGGIVFNTFFIAGWTVILGLAFGLGIAYLAYQPVRGASIYRTLLIWPYAVSPAIAGIIFFVMFDPVGGVINFILGSLGLPEPDWIRDAWLARWTIIIASVWKTLGYNILFYIAGLQNVPKELLEAAAIDGANAWQRFRSVIIPLLSPITFFLIITNITYAFFELFGTVDFLTKGGPAGATSIMIYRVYTLGIIQGDLGRAAAQSIVLFIMVIGITILQFRTSGRQVNYGA